MSMQARIECKSKGASTTMQIQEPIAWAQLVGPAASTTMQAMRRMGSVRAAHLAHTPVPVACSLAINDALQAYLDEGGT